MLVSVEYVVAGNSMSQVEIYGQSTAPRSLWQLRRAVAEIRWGRRWALYVWHVKVLSVEVLTMALSEV